MDLKREGICFGSWFLDDEDVEQDDSVGCQKGVQWSRVPYLIANRKEEVVGRGTRWEKWGREERKRRKAGVEGSKREDSLAGISLLPLLLAPDAHPVR